MYIVGVGRTKFGVLDKGLPELAYEAMLKALDDAELSVKDLDAIYCANFCAGPFTQQLHLNSLIAALLPGSNMPIIRIETACASGGAALYQAFISLSKFENIMVVAVEKMTHVDSLHGVYNIAMAGDASLDQSQGLIFPASYALIAQQHMLEYGTTLDDLALISFKNHKNANLNELAHFYEKEVDLDMIKDSVVVCSPLRLFDCSPISDGAAAVIVSRDKRSSRDTNVIGASMATDSISLAQRKVLTSFTATKLAAAKAYKQAKLESPDIDFLEVHDCFTIAELIAMEDLGFCRPGEGKYMIRDGRTMLDGDIPVNVDGGLKADGHPVGASGIAQVIEVVTQCRGEAGKRQVKNAEIGLSHNVGGAGGTAVVHIMRRGN